MIVIWKERKGTVPQGKLHTKAIAAAKLTASKKGVYIASTEGVFKYLDLSEGAFT